MSSTTTTRQSLEEIFAAACSHARKAAVLASVESLLGWDERTMMPLQAATYRAEQAAALALLVHQHRTDPVQAERLAQLTESSLATAGPSHTQATIRLLSRDPSKRLSVWKP